MAVTTTWRERLRRLFTVSLSELNPLSGPADYVGIDIGSSSIKMIEVRRNGTDVEVVRWGSEPTPAGAIQNNMVIEPARTGAILRGLLDRCGVRAHHAVTAVPGPAVMIKRMTVPAQNAQELERTMLAEAMSFIPEELYNVNIDYQILDHLDASKQLDVLLVAAKKDLVSSYAETLRAAGLAPAVVDVDYFALDNVHELNYDPAPDRLVALVNVGARYSSMNIVKGGRPTFTGDVAVGGRDITEALARDLVVSAHIAEQIKAGDTADGLSIDQVTVALGRAIDAVVEEIHDALNFFWTAASDDQRIDAVYLSGGAARTPGLRQRLSERVGAPVTVVDPVARATINAALQAEVLRAGAPELAVAVGLAMRRSGDR